MILNGFLIEHNQILNEATKVVHPFLLYCFPRVRRIDPRDLEPDSVVLDLIEDFVHVSNNDGLGLEDEFFGLGNGERTGGLLVSVGEVG